MCRGFLLLHSRLKPLLVAAVLLWGTKLLMAGTVIAWGDGNSGGLNGNGLTNVAAIAAGDWLAMALKSNGTVQGWGNFWSAPPAGLSDVITMEGGGYHCLALKTNRTVVAWGSNSGPLGENSGQAIVPVGLGNVVAVAGGGYHSLALKADGTVVAWGRNAEGQATVPHNLSNVVSIAAGGFFSMALRSDGTVRGWGRFDATLSDLSNVVAIAAGSSHGLALLANGTISAGNEPVPTGLSNVVAVSAGGFHSVCLRNDGSVFAWGSGDVAPAGLSNVVGIASGWSFDLALIGEIPYIVGQPIGRSIYSGATAVLKVNAVGTAFSYQWQLDGTNLLGATNSLLTLENVQPRQTGFYQALISCPQRMITSSNAYLNVIMSAPIVLSQTADCVVEIGTNTSVAVLVTGSEPLTYRWQFNGTIIPGETNSILKLTNVQSTTSGLYKLVASNAFGVVSNSGTRVTAKDLPSAVNAAGLVWTTYGNSPWFFQTNTTHDGVAAAQSGIITESYQESVLETTVTGPGTLTFWCALSSGWGTEFLGFSVDGVQQFYLPRLSVGWHYRTIYVPAGDHALQWSFYTPFNADWRDAAWLDEVQFTPGPTPPEFSVVPTNQTLSAGANVTFLGQAFGTPTLQYQWQFKGVDLPGATNTALLLTNVQQPHAGVYRLVVTNDYGETNSAAVLAVNPMPPVLTLQPASKRLVVNSSTFLSVAAKGSEPFTYQWQFNEVDIFGATNALLPLPTVQITNSGNYRVMVANSIGQVTTSNALIIISTPLVIAWGAGTNVTSPPHLGQSQVPWALTNATAIGAGYFHSVALTSNGTVSAWGDNSYGQVSVSGLTNISSVSAGAYHNLGLRFDGSVVAWGAGTNFTGPPRRNQSKVPVNVSNVIAVAAGGVHSLALDRTGRVSAWGDYIYSQTNVPPGLSNVVAIAAGGSHSLALTKDGFVVAWGAGVNFGEFPHFGQSRVPVELSNVVAIAAATYHSMALRADGTVVCWGDNTFGQTIPPPGLSNVVAIAAGEGHSVALRKDGSLVSWGSNSYNKRTIPEGISNVVAIAGGGYHTLVMVNDGGPFVTRHPFYQTLNVGTTASLEVEALGDPPLSYQWRFNGIDLQGATNASITFSTALLESAGSYACVISNRFGNTVSAPAILTVLRTSPRFHSFGSRFDQDGFSMTLGQLSGHGSIILYASTNLIDWQPIATNPSAIGSLQLLDRSATNLPLRYYRAGEE
jgi:alpha-tubulin suppressor-like RCC1 family protein